MLSHSTNMTLRWAGAGLRFAALGVGLMVVGARLVAPVNAAVLMSGLVLGLAALVVFGDAWLTRPDRHPG